MGQCVRFMKACDRSLEHDGHRQTSRPAIADTSCVLRNMGDLPRPSCLCEQKIDTNVASVLRSRRSARSNTGTCGRRRTTGGAARSVGQAPATLACVGSISRVAATTRFTGPSRICQPFRPPMATPPHKRSIQHAKWLHSCRRTVHCHRCRVLEPRQRFSRPKHLFFTGCNAPVLGWANPDVVCEASLRQGCGKCPAGVGRSRGVEFGRPQRRRTFHAPATYRTAFWACRPSLHSGVAPMRLRTMRRSSVMSSMA